ncbi:Phospholipase [hydrothermal vent metagenome]|uniref:Phospholipase n=1 Tax=hydrothermal vent metagenome TaxID=652676 RepID=A0A3B1AU32_9ZZZZ
MAERFVDRLDVYPDYWRRLVADHPFHGRDFANNTFKNTDKGRASRLLFLGIIKLYPVKHLDGQDSDKPPVRFPLLSVVKGSNYTLVPPSVLLVESSPIIKKFSDQQQATRFLADLNIDSTRLNELSMTMGIATANPEPVKQIRKAETKVKETQKPHVITLQITAMAQALMDRQFFLLEQQPESRPPKRTGSEDLPVEEYTPKPYTLGPHEEPGYVPPPPVAKSDTEKRKENYEERKQLAANANDTPEQQAAAARLLDNNDNILRAESAAYVYRVDEFNREHIDALPEAPTGLNLLDPKEIPGLENATFTSKKTGFGAALFESEINGETMLTYRGTNNKVTGWEDWRTNIAQGVGQETAQYDQAMYLAELTNKTLEGNFVTVGHSLGGGLASAATAVTGVKGYTYNAAGLHPETAVRKGGMANDATGKLIQTRAVEGEVLTGTQRHGNKTLSGLGAGGGALAGGLVGAGLGYLLSKALPKLPEAAGEMKTLPSVNGGNPVTRHGMDQVIDGIEAQKKEDINTLSSK